METYSFLQIDVFSRVRYLGNAAAVVFDADPIDEAMMQVISRQMNLSETVFLCSPTSEDAHYRARIFTPRSELPFAGHPTIAAAHAWYHRNRAAAAPPDEIRQECAIGIVTLAVEGEADSPLFMINMGEPVHVTLPLAAADAASMLGCREADIAAYPIESCSTGLPWMIVSFADLDALRALTPNQQAIEACCREHGAVGLSAYAMAAEREECDVHVRSFAPGEGIPEDPVCGSGNGAVALHIARHLHASMDQFRYTAEQGREMGYEGTIHVEVSGNANGSPSIRIGGHAVTVMQGELFI